mmetsp:Transcript_1533/g.6062  ORF Transcript_1533/g.6062 Transcript_1533/m.6062 type:complete len:83 (-) Transcript_1533:1221-1469(-)
MSAGVRRDAARGVLVLAPLFVRTTIACLAPGASVHCGGGDALAMAQTDAIAPAASATCDSLSGPVTTPSERPHRCAAASPKA